MPIGQDSVQLYEVCSAIFELLWVFIAIHSKFRAESDLEHQHLEKGRLQSQIEQLKRDLSQAYLREKQLDKINKSVSNKLKVEKEEVFSFLCGH